MREVSDYRAGGRSRILRIAIIALAVCLSVAVLGQVNSAHAVTPVTVTAKLVASDGSPLVGARARYGSGTNYSTAWFTGGSGYTDANGETTVQLVPGTYSFEMLYAGTAQRKIGVVVAEDSTLTFHTTNVTIQYTDQVAYGGANGDSAWFKQTPDTASKELLGDGVTPVRFRLHGTGGLPGRLGMVLPEATTTGVTFTRSFIALRLVDSTGAPLNGGTARYKNGSWAYAPGSTGSEVSAPGILAYAIPGLATTITNEMRFNGTTQTKIQDASDDSVYQFQTRALTLRLESCSTEAPLNGGNPRFGIGPTTYWTMWFPGGVTGTSAPGETSAQIFPGTYSFEMLYKGTADRKLAEVVPDADTTITWKTTKVTLAYSGAISYGGATGDSAWFTKPSMELLPGTYKFHFRGGDTVDLTIGGCSFSKTAVMIRLVDSTGAGLADGTVYYFAGGGSYPSLPGATDANGNLFALIDGSGNREWNMTYANLRQTKQQDALLGPVVFQTKLVTVELRDSTGALMDTGTGVRYWGAGANRPFGGGSTSGGVVTMEMLPPNGGNVEFGMTYLYTTTAKSQNIVANPVVTFQTGKVDSVGGTCWGYWMAGGFRTFTNGMELFPANYEFRFTDAPIAQNFAITAGNVNTIR